MTRNEQTALDAKTHYYASDGTGRDTYILKNNGGWFKERQVLFQKNSYQRPLSNCQKVRSEAHPKNVHYHSDGSGRDKYIITDEGGLSKLPTHFKQNVFQKNLRCYEKLPNWNLRKPDYFQMSQNSIHQLERPKSALLANKQQKLSQRLSIAKQR